MPHRHPIKKNNKNIMLVHSPGLNKLDVIAVDCENSSPEDYCLIVFKGKVFYPLFHFLVMTLSH